MEDMRSLGSRCRGRDEVCEINGSKVVKRREASQGEVLRTWRVAAEDLCLSLRRCEFLCEPACTFVPSRFSVMFSPEF